MPKLKRGIYRHYKGKHYWVFGVAILSGTEDATRPIHFALYRPMYGKRMLTVRPLEEFLEPVRMPGSKRMAPRFTFIRRK